MELFLVLPLALIVWLWLMPGRAVKRAKKYRFAGIGALLLALAGGWIGMQVTARPSNAPVDYAAGDDELRAILDEPEQRFSSR